MRKKDIHVFKLTHTYLKDEPEFCIKTELNEKDFVKLIKVLQVKANSMEETFDLSPAEMFDLLLQYKDNRLFPREKDIKEMEEKGEKSYEYIEVDLYNIWEAKDVVVTEEEIKDKKYENKNVIHMIQNFINENNAAIEMEENSH